MTVVFVNGMTLQFTLDELFSVFRRLPSLLTALGFVAALATFSAYSDLREILWYKQVFFWISGIPVFVYCFLAGLILCDHIRRSTGLRAVPEPLVMLVTALLVTFTMVPVACAIAPIGLADMGRYTLYNFFLWEVGMLLYASFVLPRELARLRAPQPAPAAPAARLTLGARSWLLDDVLCVSAQDHYLNIRSRTETELVLGRLTDLEDTPAGSRVHRSHWVNFAAVRELQKSDGKLALVMLDGFEVPVSRANRSAVLARLARLAKTSP